MTSLYPTPDRPEAGPFVARRVQALRDRNVEVRVVAARTYRHGGLRRHAAMLWDAVTATGSFDGVEGHVLFPASLIALLAARLRGIPFIVYAHGSDVAVAARRTPLHRALARLVARGAALVVTNSSDTARHVRELGAEPIIISPGVDFDRFQPGDRGAVRTRLGIEQGSLVALYVGSLDRRKGADIFVSAIDQTPGWCGVLIGTGELRSSLDAGRPRVRFEGALAPSSVPDWMVAADVVVAPSRREPLGLAAVEALASGTPVVASAVGGLRDVVRDGENGLLVAPGDPAAVSQALERLRDPALRANLAAAARSSVLGHDIRASTAAMAAAWSKLGLET